MTKNPNKQKKEPSLYRRFKNKKGLNIGLGDLVEFEWWNNRKPVKMKGIVLGLPPDWYVINGHADVRNCIVAFDNITKIIKRQAINPELMKYLHR